MFTIEIMRLLSGAIANGKRIVTITENGVYTFKTRREAHKHVSFKVAHITLAIRDIVGGLYVNTDVLFGKH